MSSHRDQMSPEEHDDLEYVQRETARGLSFSIESDSDIDDVKQQITLQAARDAYIAAARRIRNRDIDVSITRDDVDSKSSAAAIEYTAPKFAEDKKLELSDDPAHIVLINNNYRRADVPDGPGSDLYSLSDVICATPRMYKFFSPTFAPAGWGGVRLVTLPMYSSTFATEYPELLGILPEKNVVICGGAAAWAMTGDKRKLPGDIDLFLYGLPIDDSESSRKQRWECVGRLVKKIRSEFKTYSELLSPGVLTIIGHRDDDDYAHNINAQKHVKFQIILRAYETVSSIVHGFDIPAASLAFDGYSLVMTTMAAFAHIYQVNIVVPEYRSTTYESRLLKYFERGFALCMPDLDIGQLTSSSKLSLAYCRLQPTHVRGNFAIGKVELVTAQPPSDYEPTTESIPSRYPYRNRSHTFMYGKDHINIKRIAADKHLMLFAHRNGPASGHPDTLADFDYAMFWNEPTKETIIPRDTLVRTIGKIARHIVNSKRYVNVILLKRVFMMPAESIERLISAISALTIKDPKVRIDITPSLTRYIEHLLHKYDDLPSAIQWWILSDPSRQYTSAINPMISDPADWYGVAYKTASTPSAELLLDTILGSSEAKISVCDSKIFDGICSICHCDVHAGDRNSVTLECGHVAHYAQAEDCMGLISWTSLGHPTCPVCRDPIGPVPVELVNARHSRRHVAPAIRIDIFSAGEM